MHEFYRGIHNLICTAGDVGAYPQLDGDWWTGMLHEFYGGYAGCTVHRTQFTNQARDVARQILQLHGMYSTVDKLEQFRSFADHLQGCVTPIQWDQAINERVKGSQIMQAITERFKEEIPVTTSTIVSAAST